MNYKSEQKNIAPKVELIDFQHCLVHLGDIARYRNNMQQAETFYRYF